VVVAYEASATTLTLFFPEFPPSPLWSPRLSTHRPIDPSSYHRRTMWGRPFFPNRYLRSEPMPNHDQRVLTTSTHLRVIFTLGCGAAWQAGLDLDRPERNKYTTKTAPHGMMGGVYLAC